MAAQKVPSSSTLDGLDLDSLPIRIRQADAARLFGLTRQRISQLVSEGKIPVAAGGRIDPSAAAASLIRVEGPKAQTKVLGEIRERIATAERERDQARTALAAAEQRLAEQDDALLDLKAELAEMARRVIDAERAIDLLASRRSDLEPDIDACFEQATEECLDRIPAEPRLRELASQAPPTRAQTADALIYRSEQHALESPSDDENQNPSL